jgi:hypothetical protein
MATRARAMLELLEASTPKRTKARISTEERSLPQAWAMSSPLLEVLYPP